MTTVELQALAGLLGAANAEIVLRCGRCGYEAVAMGVADLVLLAAQEKREGIERVGTDAMQALLTHECRPKAGAAS